MEIWLFWIIVLIVLLIAVNCLSIYKWIRFKFCRVNKHYPSPYKNDGSFAVVTKIEGNDITYYVSDSAGMIYPEHSESYKDFFLIY